ncbi:MAG: ABC transporter permease, partial [Chloroflexi bacterium]|nr:ABC transporter permease [Chloroflexota bacterium]
MLGYILRRLLSLCSVLLVVSALVFVLMNLVPGGPFTLADRGYSGAALENLERKYGLDKPLHVRYINYLTSALQLDFGNSFSVAGNPPVTELIARIWPVTFQLGLYTILLSFGLGITLGIIAAYYHNGIVDNLVTFVATAGIAVPNFIIATWFLLIFGFQNGWGVESKWIIGPIVPGGAAVLSWDYFLPVLTYALAPLALVSRYTRSSFSDALTADFIRTARAKGLSERFIMLRHVFRNALIPMIT